MSGYVATKPTVKSVYTFHLNDAFQFQQNIRVAVETVAGDDARALIGSEHPIWATTAFWYAPSAQPAGSDDAVYLPSRLEYVRRAAASQPAANSVPAKDSAPARP